MSADSGWSGPARRAAALAALLGAAGGPVEAARQTAASEDFVEIAAARENIQSLLETYLSKLGSSGRIELRTARRTALMKLRSVDPGTIHRVSSRTVSALAAFEEDGGKAGASARIEADFSGPFWKITALRWLRAAEADSLGARFRAASRAQALEDAARPSPRIGGDARKRSAGEGGVLDVTLETADGAVKTRLLDCPAPTCLTVLVSPSCDYCRMGTGAIKQLFVYLGEFGVASRLVVARGESGSMQEYASEFGPQAYLDPRQDLRLEGQPHFVVSDAAGKIRRKVVGLPPGYEAPRVFAEALGFPY